ncbi:ABC transporter substrate-binding protein [Sciscionella marina]|uniref:ABC transporter substrate-binding protein n=1 Tax=Sciscionella marina TaxID=508770 RepID=UPI00039F54D1|nr:ABC transporter substrate-binding protein [Sciscionella marina]
MIGTRRRIAVLLGICAVLLGLCTACGSEKDGRSGPVAPGFPVRVPDGKQTVTVPDKPKRVVALGYADIAIARALGAPIVGAVRYPQGADGRNFPGVRPNLDAEVADLDLANPNLERISALHPDLILATAAQPGYGAVAGKLAQLAPTLSAPGTPGDWRAQTTAIGAALGAPDKARQLLAKADGQLGTFVREHPYLRGKTAVFGQTVPAGLQLIVGPDAATPKLFDRLGLRVPERFAAAQPDQQGAVTLSRERLGDLSAADAAFLYFYAPGFRETGTLTRLDLVRQRRLLELDGRQAYALLQPNPANIGYVLDAIRPTLERLRG